MARRHAGRRAQDSFIRTGFRTTHADALHHAGRRGEARRRFEQAETMQAARRPLTPRLIGPWGFRYSVLLVFEAEQAAWRATVERGEDPCLAMSGVAAVGGTHSSTLESATVQDRTSAACDDVLDRAAYALEVSTSGQQERPLDIGLGHLMQGRAMLYQALLTSSASAGTPSLAFAVDFSPTKRHLDAAIAHLRRAGHVDYLLHGLLTRAWLHHLLANPTAAGTDLDEADSIATRGPMPIFLADIHLTRARLFRDRTELAKARELLADLRTHGYHRHDEMLADAEVAANNWPAPAK